MPEPAMKPIRVLNIVSTFCYNGGIESILLNILKSYDRERFHHDVCCITSEENTLGEEARALGVELLFCRKSVDLRGFSARFRDLLAGRGYDVVHSHVNSWSGALLRGAAQAGVPVRVAHIHSAAASLAGRNVGCNPVAKLAAVVVDAVGLRWISRYATHIVGVSQPALDIHWPSWRSEPNRFFLWAGGVDTDRFTPRADSGTERGQPPTLIAVGSFTPDKNQFELLDILAAIRRRVPGTRLTLIGKGTQSEALRRCSRDKGLEDAVAFLGIRPDIPDLLSRGDVFVSASKREGLPQAVLEAQAAGLPTVASDIPPHREAVAPELHGLLYPLGRAETAADHIARLLNSADLRHEAGAAARRFIIEKFGQKAGLTRLQDWHAAWVASGTE
jgi:glycosyltransferase involved in cell wall biosynthesis